MKNKKLLDDFTAYCVSHPGERFWQALRNWARVEFLYASKISLDNVVSTRSALDTFYIEKKHPFGE